jgi:hypothetical protein
MRIIAGTFVALAALALLTSPALAQLGVSPGSMDMLVPEGQHTLPSITVSNDSDKPMDFEVELAGYGQGTDGSTEVLEPDTNPLSAALYISFTPGEFSLEPGESQQIDLTVSIPQGIDGGRYAVVLVIATPGGGEPITTISRMGILVRLTIDGSNLIQQGTIEQIGSEPVESGTPIPLKVTYANEGNVHCRVQGSVTIFDAQGDILDVARTSWAVVLPGYSRQLIAEWIPDRDLAPGTYDALATVSLEDGTLLAEGQGSLEVGMPYVPPTPPVTITLTATSASTLQTDDGRFSISFPQGAVFSDVDISLRDYPLGQLPPLPSGYSLAATAFRVDGLPGLLAKEATVTVKYLSADLQAAQGDAARLKLARWDAADNQWTVLETKLDRQAMTISADTNQLGIWAIMVGPPAGVNWALIGGVAAGVVALGLLVYLLVVRRRRTS